MSTSKSAIGYETIFIVRPDHAEESRKALLDKLKGIIESHKGTIVLTEDWGRRKLAYDINRENKGYYTYIVYTADNKCVHEIERNMRLNESVLRFLTVKLGDDFDPSKFKRKVRPEPKSDREPSHREERGAVNG
ncbi:MAG: 30S ribosomal protein S6 [Bacteriovoracia bacterium]